IHAGPAVTPTTNGPVVWGFFGSPFNDNNPNDFVFSPFPTGVGGTFSGKWDLPEGNGTNLAAQLPNILAGRSYINFHTTKCGGGGKPGGSPGPGGGGGRRPGPPGGSSGGNAAGGGPGLGVRGTPATGGGCLTGSGVMGRGAGGSSA